MHGSALLAKIQHGRIAISAGRACLTCHDEDPQPLLTFNVLLSSRLELSRDMYMAHALHFTRFQWLDGDTVTAILNKTNVAITRGHNGTKCLHANGRPRLLLQVLLHIVKSDDYLPQACSLSRLQLYKLFFIAGTSWSQKVAITQLTHALHEYFHIPYKNTTHCKCTDTTIFTTWQYTVVGFPKPVSS